MSGGKPLWLPVAMGMFLCFFVRVLTCTAPLSIRHAEGRQTATSHHCGPQTAGRQSYSTWRTHQSRLLYKLLLNTNTGYVSNKTQPTKTAKIAPLKTNKQQPSHNNTLPHALKHSTPLQANTHTHTRSYSVTRTVLSTSQPPTHLCRKRLSSPAQPAPQKPGPVLLGGVGR